MRSENHVDLTTATQAYRRLGLWLCAGLLVIFIFFRGFCYLQHAQESSLLAAGLTPWADSGFYIRIQPGHNLTLIQRYTNGNEGNLVFPAFMAGLAAMVCMLLWAGRHKFKQKPRTAIPLLLFIAYLACMSAVLVIRSVYRPEALYINLDANIIATSNAGTIPLSQITGFGYTLLSGSKNSAWWVGANMVNGKGVRLIAILNAPPFPEYGGVPKYVAKTVQDFVISHGTQFPRS